MRLCLLLILKLLHFIFIPFSPMFSFCLLSFPFCSTILILKITLRFLIYVIFLSTFLHLSLIYYIVPIPAIILAFVYFPLLFTLPVLDPLPSSPTPLLVCLQLLLVFVISLFIIYGPASFLYLPSKFQGTLTVSLYYKKS